MYIFKWNNYIYTSSNSEIIKSQINILLCTNEMCYMFKFWKVTSKYSWIVTSKYRILNKECFSTCNCGNRLICWKIRHYSPWNVLLSHFCVRSSFAHRAFTVRSPCVQHAITVHSPSLIVHNFAFTVHNFAFTVQRALTFTVH